MGALACNADMNELFERKSEVVGLQNECLLTWKPFIVVLMDFIN